MKCNSKENPLNILKEMLKLSKFSSGIKHKSAVCLSTISNNGFPNSRFLDLKEVTKKGLIFCSSFDSTKAKEIENNSSVSLTSWWEHINLQIRVIGVASKLEKQSDFYWEKRTLSAKLATIVSNQSSILNPNINLLENLTELQKQNTECKLNRPINWGAYIIEPFEIEFLNFEENRLHTRMRFRRIDNEWTNEILQP